MSITAAPAQAITPDDGLVLTDAPQGLVGTLTLAIRTLADETVITAAATTSIVEYEQTDGTSNYGGTRTAPDDNGSYEFVWDDGTTEYTEDLTVRGFEAAEDAFATAAQVAVRLGRGATSANPFTAAETETATMLCGAATGLIADAAGKDEDWATGLDPIPSALNTLCVEVVCRAMANPSGLTAVRQQLAAYSISQNFQDTGLMLTDAEDRMVRRVVFGHSTGSARMRSVFSDAERIMRREQGWL